MARKDKMAWASRFTVCVEKDMQVMIMQQLY